MMTRLPPHNLEAEQCVLGTILLGEDTLVKVIELLGGTAEIAAALKLPLPAVSNWKKRGIAKARLLDVLALAEQRGMKSVTYSALKQASA